MLGQPAVNLRAATVHYKQDYTYSLPFTRAMYTHERDIADQNAVLELFYAD